MLPGFIPRLHSELLRILTRQTSPSSTPDGRGRSRPTGYDRYAALRPLAPHIAILNTPTPPPPASARAVANAGKAPAFTPACMAWVGGSLAGCVFSAYLASGVWHMQLTRRPCDPVCRALKTGGVEVAREKWDEADVQMEEDEEDDVSPTTPRSAARSILPDWTRSPLPAGAPPANVKPAAAPVLQVQPQPLDVEIARTWEGA